MTTPWERRQVETAGGDDTPWGRRGGGATPWGRRGGPDDEPPAPKKYPGRRGGGGTSDPVPLFYKTERGNVALVRDNFFEGEDKDGHYVGGRREDFEKMEPVYRRPGYTVPQPRAPKPGEPTIGPRSRTLGERFTDTWEDTMQRGPAMAGVRALLPKGTWQNPGDPNVYTALGTQVIDLEKERRDTYDQRTRADPFYKAPGGIVGKALAGTTTLGGALSGNFTDPINAGAAGITGGQSVLGRMAVQGGTNAALDAGTQGIDLATGTQDQFNPWQTGGAGVLGAAFPAGGALVDYGSKAGGNALRDFRTNLDPKVPGVDLNGRTFGGDTPWGRRLAGEAPSPPLRAAPKRGKGRGEPAPQETGGGFNEAMARAAIRQAFPGSIVTSGRRSVEHNAEVGGAANSWHTKGGAIDIDPRKAGMTTAELKARIAAYAKANGLPVVELIDEGDHVHWAFGNGGRAGGVTDADNPAPFDFEPTAREPDPEPITFTPKGEEPPFSGEPIRDPAPRGREPKDPTDEALDYLRRGERVQAGQGPSLLDWISREGGLRDDGGELSSADLDIWHKGKPFKGRAVREDGASVEEMAQRAYDAGYFRDVAPPRMDGADNMQPITGERLVQAIREELAGKPRFARDPDPVAIDLEARTNDLQEVLDHLGIDPRQHSNADIKAALNEFFAKPDPVLASRAGKASPNPLAAPVAPVARVQNALLAVPEPGRKGNALLPDSEPVRLADGVADQRLIPGVEPVSQAQRSIAAELRRRQAQRGAEPMRGGLFDEQARSQGDLFSGPDYEARGAALRERVTGRLGGDETPRKLLAKGGDEGTPWDRRAAQADQDTPWGRRGAVRGAADAEEAHARTPRPEGNERASGDAEPRGNRASRRAAKAESDTPWGRRKGGDTLASGRTFNGLRDAPRPGAVKRTGNAAELAGKTVSDLARKLQRTLGIKARQGRLQGGRRNLGEYNTGTGVVRVRPMHEMDVLSHEWTHALEFKKSPELTKALAAHHAELKPLAYPGAPPGVAREEGFAEFGRWYLTNPDHARKVAPKFYAAFEAAMQKDMPEVLKDMREIQAAYQTLLKSGSIDLAAASVAYSGKPGPFRAIMQSIEENGLGDTVLTLADNAYTSIIDDLHPIAVAERKLKAVYAENFGGKRPELKVAQSPYALARLNRDSFGAGHNDIIHGVTPYKGVDPKGPSLADALEKALGSKFFGKFSEPAVREFDAYLIARRMKQEWKRYEAGQLDNPPDRNSPEHHEQTIKDAEAAHPTWRDAAQMIYSWNNALWDKEHAAGLISNEVWAAGKSKVNYVPLMREINDRGGGGRPRGSMQFAGGSKRFKGSTRDVISPLSSMMRRAYELNTIIKRNEVMKALDDLGQMAGRGAGDIVERLPRTELDPQTFKAAEALEKAAEAAGIDPRDISTMMKVADMEAEVTLFRSREMQPKKGESVVWVWRNGQKHPLLLADGEFGRDMFTALTGMTDDMRNVVIDAMAAVNQVKRVGITAAPEFMTRNYIRDQIATWITTDVGFKPVITSARGAVDELTQSQLAVRYTSAGGMKGGANVAATRNLYPQNDRQAFAKIQQLQKKGYKVKRFLSWRGLAEATDLSETSTRLGVARLAFNQAKKRGLNDYEAMLEAAFVSRDYLDFGKHGSRTLPVVRIVTFLNAALQGLDKTTRVLTAGGNLQRVLAPLGKNAPQNAAERRALAHAYKAWAKVSALGAFGLALRMMYEGDPEYEEIGDRLRATHWVFKLGGKWMFVPKPFELATASNIFERAYEAGALKDPKAGERLAGDLAVTVVPPYSVAALQTPFDIARNRNAFGQPIVPDHLKGSVDPALQYNAYNSELSKKLGQAFGVSPAVIDYSFTGYGGTLGRYFLDTTDAAADMAGARPKVQAGLEDAFLTRAFVKEPTRGATSQKQYWDMMSRDGGKLTQAEGSFRALLNKGDDDAALAYLRKLSPDARAFVQAKVFSVDGSSKYHPLVRAQGALSVISDMRREVRDGSIIDMRGRVIEMTPSQRREADDALAYLSMTEMRNALVMTGVKGWAQKEPIPYSNAIDRLNAINPDLLGALEGRMQLEKIPGPAAISRVWEVSRGRLEGAPDEAQLRRLMSGKRLKAPDKIDQIREAGRLATAP